MSDDAATGIAIAVRPSAMGVLTLAAVVAMVIALVTGWFTAVQNVDLAVVLKRLLAASAHWD